MGALAPEHRRQRRCSINMTEMGLSGQGAFLPERPVATRMRRSPIGFWTAGSIGTSHSPGAKPPNSSAPLAVIRVGFIFLGSGHSRATNPPIVKPTGLGNSPFATMREGGSYPRNPAPNRTVAYRPASPENRAKFNGRFGAS
jgi:hypothetical protein